MTRIVLATAALLAALVLPTGAAAAHAELLSMTPKDGSTFAKAPTEVVLRYSEAIQTTGSEVVVTSPSGTTVSAGEPNIVDEVVTERLTSMTEAGVYRIVARVISEDGHPVTATGTFTVTTGTHVAAAPARPPTSTPVSSTNNRDAAAAASAVVLLIVAALGIAVAQRRKEEEKADT
jgi:methionine-rich copper-binding protein CopC